MTTKEALVILVQQTKLFKEEIKVTLIDAIPTMVETQVQELGRLLARFEQDRVLNIDKEIASVDAVIKLIDKRLHEIESEKSDKV